MKEVLHFRTQEERLKYLRGGFKEIEAVEVSAEVEKADDKPTDSSEGKSAKKGKKGKKKDDTVQAE